MTQQSSSPYKSTVAPLGVTLPGNCYYQPVRPIEQFEDRVVRVLAYRSDHPTIRVATHDDGHWYVAGYGRVTL